MSENVKTSPLFEGRETEPQKVTWMTTLYPRVNGPEYRAFRKAHDGKTHHDKTVELIVESVPMEDGRPPQHKDMVAFLVEEYVERDWQAGDIMIQVAQYLGQLTGRGWTALLNAATVGFTKKL